MSERRVLRVDHVDLTRGDVTVCRSLDFEFHSGEFVAIVGPNGAGKSSALALLAGDVAPTTGSVTLDGTALTSLDAVSLARRRSVMTQTNDVHFPFGVREVVQMGRFPWADTPAEVDDERVVEEVMRRVEIEHLANRKVTTLSGGEQARVALARLLAQSSDVAILDEPTAALDIRHQEIALDILRAEARSGRLVIVVLHDVEAAAAYADRVIVLERGAVRADGVPRDVLTSGLLSEVYSYPVVVRHHTSSVTSIAPDRAHRLSVSRNPQPQGGEQ